MKKRILSLVLVLAMVVGMLPSVAFATGTIPTSGTCGDNLMWTLDSEGTLRISGAGEMWDCTNMWNVTGNAMSTPYINEIVIEYGVTSIGAFAFDGFKNLKKVVIPQTITKIGLAAFIDCESLVSVNIPDSVTELGEGCFEGCSALEQVSISENLTKIENSAFGACTNLKTLVIPESVTYIGEYTFAGCINLVELAVPKNVTFIGDGAFSGCSNLLNVTLPEGITSIEDYTFSKCNFKSIVIPDSVVYIGIGAFEDCSNLESLMIPKNVDHFKYYAFSGCKKLKNITIHKSVRFIGMYAFSECTSLENVYYEGEVTDWGKIEIEHNNNCLFAATIHYNSNVDGGDDNPTDSLKLVSQYPKAKGVFADDELKVSMTFNHDVESVQAGISFDEDNNTIIHGNFSIVRQIEEADDWKFETVYGLQDGDNAETDVMIDGKTVTIDVSDAELIPGETYYILMDNGVISFKNTEEQIGFAGTQWSFTISGASSGTFRYKASYGITEYPYTYDDNWFLGDCKKYNHELAKMSLKTAIAAYGTGSNTDGSEYIQELMRDKLGFSNLDVYYPESKRNSIGYAIGSKEIPSENGKGTQSLILVAIRGGKYGIEWGGNFTIGTGDLSDGLAGEVHEGFSRAAEQVEDGLASYIKWNREEGKLSEDCIVWVVGYSRAAATANLLAKRLDDGNIEGIGGDNVFAYCFECPQNSRAKNLTSEKYNNIMNIVNPLDFVTMVAMDEWKYGRYGQTFYLPYEEGVSDYSNLKYQMIQEYIDIISFGKKGGDAFAATEQVPGQKDMIMGAMNWLADEFGSPEEYAALYQEALVEVIEAFQTGEWKPVSSTAAATMLLIKLGFVLKGTVGLPAEPKDLVDKLIGLGDDINAIMIAELFLFGLNERGSFKETHVTYSHYPELCLAWMESLTVDEIISVDKKYRKVFVNCPVDIAIYDSNDTLVGSVVDKNVQEIKNGVSIYIDDNEQIVVSLPMTEKYRINTTATGSGTVTYTVSEYNIDTNNSERVVSYPLVEIKKGDRLVGTVENLDEIDIAEYNLIHNETELSASVDQSGEKVKEYNVLCIIDGNGKVFGGGKGISGEYRKIIAMPEENAEFLGWYNGNKLISTEFEYRFCLLENVELTAKFTKTELNDIGTGGGLAAGGDTSNKGADNFNNTQANDAEKTENIRFTDLYGYSWAADAITNLVNKGIIKGTSATTYSPANNIIRADFVALVVRMFNLTSADTANFADVNASDYFAAELAIARNNGIVGGIGDNEFAPRGNITRQDMMVMLYRAMQKLGIELSGTQATDVSDMDTVSGYAKEAVETLMANGIINGKNGKIDPMASATRAEVAVMLNRVLDLVK